MANTTNGFSGFSIFESDDELDIAEYVTTHTLAGMKTKIYPIWDSNKFLEHWEKLNEWLEASPRNYLYLFSCARRFLKGVGAVNVYQS